MHQSFEFTNLGDDAADEARIAAERAEMAIEDRMVMDRRVIDHPVETRRVVVESDGMHHGGVIQEIVDEKDVKPFHKIVGVAPAQDGVKKFDGGKVPVFQGFLNRFPRAIMAIAMVSEYGMRKYGTFDGWEKLPDGTNRYKDAKGRHGLLHSVEGAYDVNDSGLPHMAQEAWNAIATLELALRAGDVVVTRGNDIVDGKPVLGTSRPV